MADLIATTPDNARLWKRRLLVGLPIVIGREEGTWEVPDEKVHRRHVEVLWDGSTLRVRKVSPEKKPIVTGGVEVDKARLKSGGSFRLGDTTFLVVDDEATVALERPDEEQTYSSGELMLPFRDANRRIDLLGRLPDVLASAGSLDEFSGLVDLLREGLPLADAILLVASGADEGPEEAVEVLYRWQHPSCRGKPIAFSRGLVRDATRRRKSIVNRWFDRSDPSRPNYTVAEGVDWAFCTPLLGDPAGGRAIYVAGHHGGGPGRHTPSADWDPRDDVKFTGLVASYLSALRQAASLSRQRAALGQFFSPVVLERLAEEGSDRVLAPREADVSVLFCDLRGFSKASEQGAADLMGLLERVGAALGVMTEQILGHGGVIGDFQGDSAMGFWGWPEDPAPGAAAAFACRAALAVRERMEAASRGVGTPLGDFRMGVGIASGRAVAGRIGTRDQAKVSVFGPVVNLASRLEGMTKLLGAPILLDEPTADAAREALGPDLARFRRVATVQPLGMVVRLTVTEVLPPAGAPGTPTDDDLARFEDALAEFRAGRWDEAFPLLKSIIAVDPVAESLLDYIKRHRVTPPDDWDGTIRMESKRADA